MNGGTRHVDVSRHLHWRVLPAAITCPTRQLHWQNPFKNWSSLQKVSKPIPFEKKFLKGIRFGQFGSLCASIIPRKKINDGHNTIFNMICRRGSFEIREHNIAIRARANAESSTLEFLSTQKSCLHSSLSYEAFAMSASKSGSRKRASESERAKSDKNKRSATDNFDLDLDFDLSEFVFDHCFCFFVIFFSESFLQFLILCESAVTSKESSRRCTLSETRLRRTVRRRTKRLFPGTWNDCVSIVSETFVLLSFELRNIAPGTIWTSERIYRFWFWFLIVALLLFPFRSSFIRWIVIQKHAYYCGLVNFPETSIVKLNSNEIIFLTNGTIEFDTITSTVVFYFLIIVCIIIIFSDWCFFVCDSVGSEVKSMIEGLRSKIEKDR